MKLEYQVHSVVVDEIEREVPIDGLMRPVRMDVLTVELTTEGSALTFRFDDAAAAQKLFQVGKPITLSFAKGK